MSPDLRGTLLQVVPFAVLLVVLALVARRRRLSPRDDLRLVWPPARVALPWVLAWVAWVALAELVSARLGVPPPPVRHGLAPAVLALRLAGMVLLAPLAEELAFRGFLFRALERTRLGGRGAVVLCALAFAALHFQYDGLGLLQVLLDGLFLGVARLRTRSVLLTAALHALGNAYAAWQRFFA